RRCVCRARCGDAARRQPWHGRADDHHARWRHLVHCRQRADRRAAHPHAVSTSIMNSQHLCIGASLIAALNLASNVAAAAEAPPRAVQSTNYSLGLVASDSDTKGSTSNGTFGLGGVATLPIGDLFGASLAGSYSRTTARTSDVLFDVTSQQSTRPSCRFNNSDAAVSFFARRATLGRVSASYGKGQVSSDCGDESVFVANGEDSLDLDYYRLAAEAYL